MNDQNSPLFLGIDGGGTSLRVMLTTQTSETVLAETILGAVADGGPQPLAPVLHDLLAPMGGAGRVSAVCAGITKFTREGVADQWRDFLAVALPEAKALVVPDYVIAFHGALPEGQGIAVIAGTGSVTYAENGQGQTVRIGGRGWEYGDEGSGAHLTTDAIRRTLRALDGLEEPTPMTEAICQELGTTDPALLAETARQRAVAESRGFLIPFLLERAQDGDAEAARLFVGAAGWLAASIRAAYRRVGFSGEETVPIATIGGLWAAEQWIVPPLTTVLQRWLPGTTLCKPQASPTIGAVRLATRLIAGAPSIDKVSVSP